ncbi:30S ribosomal protein S10 [Wolbachia endosymbiont of Dipetalonema caudispina]|uniref:30S ribosomal protein S10 n=1 Tax=Wolbachia endosymbiont of Dipetalonema caudispina TaxID=1812112 RepID=UPI001589BE77|nr:30S ribosomal protein S10 [Wolbachia endosymbiont of Dipetalonema caudispina]QKX01180.1 30S ribosomal protein S10 [Wolbachia endosymbiont of Dipetalonema caudispina]
MEQEIHIKIEAFDCSRLEEYIRKFVREFKDKLKHSGTRLSGPIALPRKNFKFNVNRSPHVDKKSREQLERRTSKRLIVLYNPTPTIVQMLGNSSFLSPLPGVEVDSKIKKVIKFRNKE